MFSALVAAEQLPTSGGHIGAAVVVFGCLAIAAGAVTVVSVRRHYVATLVAMTLIVGFITGAALVGLVTPVAAASPLGPGASVTCGSVLAPEPPNSGNAFVDTYNTCSQSRENRQDAVLLLTTTASPSPLTLGTRFAARARRRQPHQRWTEPSELAPEPASGRTLGDSQRWHER
jgi:hypothetical protein